MNKLSRLLFAVPAIVILTFSTLKSQNWPQWRGPSGDGIAEKGSYPANFSIDNNLLWKAELPGKGGSTPIVWNDQIILTSGIGEGSEGEDGVLCYSMAGDLLWQTKLGKQLPGRNPRGTGSNPSATTDGKRLFVFFKSGTVAALDLEGKVLWKQNLRENYGDIVYFWDLGSSPLLVGNNVVLTVMHEGKSYILALDKETGKEVWKTDRNYTCGRESAQSYTTPLAVKEGSRTILIVWGADHLTGHDAENGKLIWSYTGFNPDLKPAWRTIASPVYSEGLVVVPYGRGTMLAAMKTGGTGTMTEKDFAWKKSGMGTDVATPVISGGKVYVLGFNGTVWCLDLLTGQELWHTALPTGNGVYYSSPVLAGNRLYIASDEGAFFVGELSETGMNIINQVSFGDNFVATPVLVRDKILVRGTKYLYFFGK
jgi:outer membrane protein assembly factor BamB